MTRDTNISGGYMAGTTPEEIEMLEAVQGGRDDRKGIAMRTIIDNSSAIKITNTAQLPRGTGCRLLLAVESPYPGEYAAKRWLRKMPETTARGEVVIRF